MNRRLIIDGNAVYEIDENCMLTKEVQEEKKDESQKNTYMEEYKKSLKRGCRFNE